VYFLQKQLACLPTILWGWCAVGQFGSFTFLFAVAFAVGKMEMCQNVRLGALVFLFERSAVPECRGLVAYNVFGLGEGGV
jgi:hypothetical protein